MSTSTVDGPETIPPEADAAAAMRRVEENLARVVHAPRDVLRRCVLALVAEGHVILEDAPGVGKTMLAKALARSVSCRFSRLQFTPDLLPTDVTGASVFDQRTNAFSFRPGPVFAHLLLVDEINRASPKTQAALLECMQEHQVTVDGHTHRLPTPFMVVATQNPLEYEGTYPLPEAQLDRFTMRLRLGYPPAEEEARMLSEQASHDPLESLEAVATVDDVRAAVEAARDLHVDADMNRYVVSLLQRTRDVDDRRDGHVRDGAGADFGPAHRLLAQAERRLDHPDRASRHERRADALGAYVPLSDAFVDTLCRESAHSTFLLKHAALAARARNPRWREWLLRRAIDVDPTNPDVVFEMATMLQATSRSTEALELYRRHETLVPGEVQTQVQIGKCLTALNRLDEAEAVLRRAAARGDAVASYNLGELLDRTNRDDEAAGQYAAALAIDPFHARALNNLALVLTRKGRMGDALPLYERAVAAAPNDPDPRNNLGSAWLQMGRVREAVASFEEALAIDPDHVDALNNIAIGLQALGRRDDALSYLRRALALSPSHVGARQNLRELGGERRP